MSSQPRHAISRVPDSGSTVEILSEAIRVLAAERQWLRAQGAGPDELEQNRLELVNCHQRLARALIDRHLPGATERHAAA